jgi:hypothetical protein
MPDFLKNVNKDSVDIVLGHLYSQTADDATALKLTQALWEHCGEHKIKLDLTEFYLSNVIQNSAKEKWYDTTFYLAKTVGVPLALDLNYGNYDISDISDILGLEDDTFLGWWVRSYDEQITANKERWQGLTAYLLGEGHRIR